MEKSLEGNDFITLMKSALDIKEVDANMYSPLNLAYIGDCVYELIVRTYLMSKGNIQVNKLHKKASDMVKAETQSLIIGNLEELLLEEEMAIYKRGRNAKSFTSAKNASITDYRRATGFEALIGYLYLKEEFSRLIELIILGLKSVDKLN